ncbi:MAG: ZIP family metal transporter [Spirochaetales bacterium]
MNILYIILISGLAAIVGTGAGALIGMFLGGKTEKTISGILTFASGTMVGIALFDLVPEAFSLGGTWVTTLGLMIGVLVVSGLNFLLDKKTEHSHLLVHDHDCCNPKHHHDVVGYEKQNEGLLRAGVVMLFAVGIHNIPAGMAIGASGAIDIGLAITLAILLTVHNLPEGMAMSVPLVTGGVARTKAFGLIMLASATTIIGSVIGALFGEIGGIATALALSFAAGSMLYIIFEEIIPSSITMGESRLNALFSILGIIVGFLITSAL